MSKVRAGAISSTETFRRSWATTACVGLAGLAILSGIAGCASSAGTQQVQTSAQLPRTLPATLSADPRFSNLVHVIRAAGQWQTFADAHDVTMLAPTNDAFDSSDADWGAVLTGVGDKAVAKRKTFLKPLLIQGMYSPSEFAGKMQDVRSIAGDVLHLDGRTPGTIIITAGHRSPVGIGFPKEVVRTSRMELPPLVTTGGLIYPVSTIIIQ